MTPCCATGCAAVGEGRVARGFEVDRFVSGDAPDGPVENLLALRRQGEGAHFAFAGHLDVVPPGNGWSTDPFEATQKGSQLYGRGAVDMKGSNDCFLAALARPTKPPARPTANNTGDTRNNGGE